MSGQSSGHPSGPAEARRDRPVLSRSLEKLFLPIIKMRGENYARQNRVQIKELSERRVAALVRGTRQYRVTLSWSSSDPTKIKTSCTCPFFRQGIPCKHLWATILVADKGRWQPELRGPALEDPLELFSDKYWNGREQDHREQPGPFAPQSFVLWFTLKREPMGYFISVCERYIKKDGSFGRTRPLQNRSISAGRLSAQDRLLLPLIEDCLSRNHVYGRPGITRRLEYVPVTSGDLEVMLPLLAETGRWSLEDASSGLRLDSLRMAEDPEARLRIRVSRQDGKEGLRLEPHIELDENGNFIPLSAPVHYFDTNPVYFILSDRLYRISGPRPEALRALLKGAQSGMKLPEKALPELMKRQPDICPGLFQLDREISPRAVRGLKPQLKLILEIRRDRIEAAGQFLYGQTSVPAVLSREREHFDPDAWVVIERDQKKEKELLDLTARLGLRLDGRARAEAALDGAAEILDRLDEAGILLEAKGARALVPGKIKRFSVKSGIDWFDLEAVVDFGGMDLSLPQMIEAYLNGDKTIRLNSGEIGILPSRWIQENLELLKLGMGGRSKKKRGLRFHASQALLLDHLMEEASCEKQVDSRFSQRLQRLKSFKGIRPLEAPEGFCGELRPYQKEALGWFRFLEELKLGGILADDMGLGKTVQVLAWLASAPGDRKDAPSLVVAPTSLLFNWINEARKFTPGLKVLNYAGMKRGRDLKRFHRYHLIVTSYGIMRRDIRALRDIRFNYVILDESQAIKNPDSVSSKAASLLDAAHRLCLTGTPLENHVGELWSQMEFLNPGLLGPRDAFFNAYVKPVNSGNTKALATLQRLVRPFILRRTKEEVASELPPKVEKLIMCPMTSEQEQLYSRLRDHYRAVIAQALEKKGAGRSRFKVLEGLLRLRQAANHPKLVGMEAESGKFQRLMSLIQEALDSGHKALIFSQFTKMLRLIRQELDAASIGYAYLDGRTPQKDREAMVTSFQKRKDLKLFLISLRAGGFGLNLTAADYVFIVDPWWNPAVELQAIDRSHRIGQSKTVVTYRLISTGTVEEKVMGLQKKKRQIAGSVLSGSRDMLTRLSAKDLEILFS